MKENVKKQGQLVKRSLTVVECKNRSDVQQELIEDAIELAHEESAELIGFTIVAIYKDAENARVSIPEDMTDNFFSTYTKEIFDEHMIPEYEEE